MIGALVDVKGKHLPAPRSRGAMWGSYDQTEKVLGKKRNSPTVSTDV